MDLAKMVREAIAKNETEQKGLAPLIYLTIPQSNEIIKVHKKLQAENKRLKTALEGLKGLTHYHYKVCNIDDQSEDEIAEYIEQALKGEKPSQPPQ